MHGALPLRECCGEMNYPLLTMRERGSHGDRVGPTLPNLKVVRSHFLDVSAVWKHGMKPYEISYCGATGISVMAIASFSWKQM